MTTKLNDIVDIAQDERFKELEVCAEVTLANGDINYLTIDSAYVSHYNDDPANSADLILLRIKESDFRDAISDDAYNVGRPMTEIERLDQEMKKTLNIAFTSNREDRSKMIADYTVFALEKIELELARFDNITK